MNPPMEPFLKQILRQIETREMLTPGESWLLAVSGGPDSMAMLSALSELWKQGHLRVSGFHIAHLNHSLRGRDSDLDADFVQQQAQRLNIPCTIKILDVKTLACQKKLSVETAARKFRYEFLIKTAQTHRCAKIALAHNADDNAETILHRILRGTGIRGLAGIPPVRKMKPDSPFTLIRPLLPVRRLDIDAFLQEHLIPYRVDRTNLEPLCTRNRIRLELLPQLREQYNPNIDSALTRLADIADMTQSFTCFAAESLSNITIDSTEYSIRLDLAKFRAEPKSLQTEILHQAMRRLHVPQQRIGYRQILSILDALRQLTHNEKSLDLPNGLTIRYDAQSVCLELCKTCSPDVRSSRPISTAYAPVPIPGTTSLNPPAAAFDTRSNRIIPIRTITAQILEAQFDTLTSFLHTKSLHQEMLDLDTVEGPLLLRTRQMNDRFHPLGAPGEKTLGDFFTDHKVPPSLRGRIALFCDSKRILYIPAVHISHAARITSQTRRILLLQWD